jgi:hypothetical protein
MTRATLVDCPIDFRRGASKIASLRVFAFGVEAPLAIISAFPQTFVKSSLSDSPRSAIIESIIHFGDSLAREALKSNFLYLGDGFDCIQLIQ